MTPSPHKIESPDTPGRFKLHHHHEGAERFSVALGEADGDVVDSAFGECGGHGGRGFVAVQEDSEGVCSLLATLVDRGAHLVDRRMGVDPGHNAKSSVGHGFSKGRMGEVSLAHCLGHGGQQLSRITV
jgi:hypothetical protein